MEFKLNTKEDESILSLNGELTLLHAARFKAELIRALDTSRKVIIDTEGLLEIDLACLQLFCAAHRSALAKGKELLLAPPHSEPLAQKIDQAGLGAGSLCGKEITGSCLWNGGDK